MSDEPAIAEHLRQPRTQPANTPREHQPPFPAWTARFAPLVEQVVMGYFGVQSATPLHIDALAPYTERFASADGPLFWDAARCEDATGAHNLMAIAYWADAAAFARWCQASGFEAWWQASEREHDGVGWFLEVVSPRAERFETLFSSPMAEGVAHLAPGMSGTIVEHGYWGSARDRLPLAQVDALAPGAAPQTAAGQGARVRIAGRDNLCLIRSGQDWSATAAHERALYVNDIQPVLRAGMDFLRDEGQAVGCRSCRLMQVLDAASGEPLEKTFGLAHFDALASLESWAKTHPTHVAIFGSFMQYVQALNFQVALRLYHEVAVIPAQAQRFEYINCHHDTGLLAG